MVVLMALVQKQIFTSLCLKWYGPCLKVFGTKRTHSRVPVLKEEALFLELVSFFVVSADRRFIQIGMYKFLLYGFTYINFYVNLFLI